MELDKNNLSKLTDEELLIEKKKLQKSKTMHALIIGFLAGVLMFGFGGWILSSDKKIGFLIPIIFPIFFIYKTIQNGKKNKSLEGILKERNLLILPIRQVRTAFLAIIIRPI